MNMTLRSLLLLIAMLLFIQPGHAFTIDNQALENLYHQYRNIGDDISIDNQTIEIVNTSWQEMSYGDFRAAAKIVSIPRLMLTVSSKIFISNLTDDEKTKLNYLLLKRLRRLKAERSIEALEKMTIAYAQSKEEEDALYCLSRIHLLRNTNAITKYATVCYQKANEIDQKIQIIKANQEITVGFYQKETLAIEKIVYLDIKKNVTQLDSCLVLADALKYVHLRKKSFNYCLDNLGF